jgi:hypothetical protein
VVEFFSMTDPVLKELPVNITEIQPGQSYRFPAGSANKIAVNIDVEKVIHVGDQAMVFIGRRFIFDRSDRAKRAFKESGAVWTNWKSRHVFSSMNRHEVEEVEV